MASDCFRWLLVASDGFWLLPMASDCFRWLLVASDGRPPKPATERARSRRDKRLSRRYATQFSFLLEAERRAERLGAEGWKERAADGAGHLEDGQSAVSSAFHHEDGRSAVSSVGEASSSAHPSQRAALSAASLCNERGYRDYRPRASLASSRASSHVKRAMVAAASPRADGPQLCAGHI